MSWICIDVGERRIGVAVSDPGGVFAQPHTTLAVARDGELPVEELRRLVDERHAEGIVVGLPKRLDGSIGTAARNAEAIAARLESELGVEVVLWDERLSSAEAERMLIAAGVRRQRRKDLTDRIAAAVILQSFLDRRREEPDSPGKAGR